MESPNLQFSPEIIYNPLFQPTITNTYGTVSIGSDSVGTDWSSIITDSVASSIFVGCDITTCQINTYDEAIEFKEFEKDKVYIKTSVLAELVSRIKELEEANAKNWAELLKEGE